MKRFLALTCILVLTFTLSVCGLAALSAPTTYQATFTLYVAPQDYDDIDYNLAVSSKVIRVVEYIITSRSVLDRVIEKTGTTLSVEELQDMISLENQSDSQFITVCVTAENDLLAMDIAEALAEIGPEIVNCLDGLDVKLYHSPKLTTNKPSWKNLFS